MAKEPDIDEIRKQALEAIRRLSKDKKVKVKESPQAPSELWPGESMDLGWWTLAKAKGTRKAIRKLARGEVYG